MELSNRQPIQQCKHDAAIDGEQEFYAGPNAGKLATEAWGNSYGEPLRLVPTAGLGKMYIGT